MEEFQHTQTRQNQGAAMKIIILLLGLLILVFLGYLLFSWLGNKSGVDFESDDMYQAIFLTNGQVYFSKVEKDSNDFITLSDIYYLRVQQNLQPATNNNQGDQPSISLVKLGNELHGPEDVMYVNMEHVLFIEPLKADSNVVQAIRKDKTGLK